MNIAARPAAFAGSYADLKFIKSRSVFQVIVEMPIEQADAFLAAFKAPQPGQEQPVALALLNPSAPSDRAQASSSSGLQLKPAEPKALPQAEGGERAAPTREAPQRCPTAAPDKLVQWLGMSCGDPRFQKWLQGYVDLAGELDRDGAANCVRQLLGVKSRSEISSNPIARQKALDLMTAYDISIGRHAEPR